MSESRFLNVEHRVANLENESLRDGNAIERLKKEDAVLENDISTLLLLLHLLDFAARRCCRDLALQKKYPCLAMPDDTSTILSTKLTVTKGS
jgi:hypothetical protein